MQEILNQLKIKAEVVRKENTGTISKYFLRLKEGEKVSRIEGFMTEIALAVKSYGLPILKVETENGIVVLEFLLKKPGVVYFSNINRGIENSDYNIPVVLGRTHNGNNLIVDLTDMPHLLLAGVTGSGKSVMLHSIISGILSSNKNIKLAIIDPKKVEFNYYSKIKNLMYPIVTEPSHADDVLRDLIDEMEERFRLMSQSASNNISMYNKRNKNKFPFITLVIDEFSDLIHNSGKEFQKNLCILAQKSRACGIHIIIATQRPSADVITGLIKANFPARISCKVASDIDSRIIFGERGAEKLLGSGDSIINSANHKMLRFQGAYITPNEIQNMCFNYERSKLASVINYIRGV